MAGSMVGGVLNVWYLCNHHWATTHVLPQTSGAETNGENCTEQTEERVHWEGCVQRNKRYVLGLFASREHLLAKVTPSLHLKYN